MGRLPADASAKSAEHGVTFGKYVKRGEHPKEFISERQALLGSLHLRPTDDHFVEPEDCKIEARGRKLLSLGKCGWPPIQGLHTLVAASHYCFAKHLPLVLSPDIIWLTITQGLSQHINLNAERLRDRFVQSEGQLVLAIQRASFQRHAPGVNNWAGVLNEFCTQIRGHIGLQTYDLLAPAFTTTTPVSAAAVQIAIMGSMKSYFKFEVHTMCAIPQFTILGTAADWRSIEQRVSAFSEIDPKLKFWTEPLIKVVDQFVKAAEGKPDLEFWRSWYKHESESGSEKATGAILSLFPYVNERVNPFVDWHVGIPRQPWEGVDMPHFPSSLAKVPFEWLYLDQRLDMQFISGLMALSYDETKGVEPVIGWAVLEKAETSYQENTS